MRVIVTSFFAFCLVCSDLSAQDNQLYIGIQYGSFSMASLKEYRQDISRLVPVNFDPVEDYPNYPGFEIGYRRQLLPKYGLTFYYNYISTGSRLYYEDYSGKAIFDQVITGNSFGVLNKLKLNSADKFHVHGGLRLGLTYSTLINEFYLKLENTRNSENEKYEFKSYNFNISPSFAFAQEIGFVYLELEFRYEFHIKGNFKSKEDSDLYLVTNDGDNVVAGWDGFRILFSVGAMF